MPAASANSGLWSQPLFVRLFVAHASSLIGSGLSSVALGLLAHQLVGASASIVLGITLTIRIVVVVFAAPWAGLAARWMGSKRAMIASDLMRAAVVTGFIFVREVWQIYALAVVLNLGSALFTPVYKATIPGVVTKGQYPKALAVGAMAYDLSNILGPSLAGLVIATIGFRGNFMLNALTFLVSAGLIFALPRLAFRSTDRAPASAMHGIKAMWLRPGLRESLFLALQVSVVGGFVLVATIDFVKDALHLPDAYYAWAMTAYGVGSVLGAAWYGRAARGARRVVVLLAPALIIAMLFLVGSIQNFWMLAGGWAICGAGQCMFGIYGNELLAGNSGEAERADIFAAHFSLSHAGWGVTYPLAGFLTDWFGFRIGAYGFGCLLFVAAGVIWVGRLRLVWMHRGLPDKHHHHAHGGQEPPGDYHAHTHRHGEVSHSHPHYHDPHDDDT